MLTEMGPRLGFAVTIIPEVTVDAGDVNSTRIRELLSGAEVEKANEMLGRSYSIRGTVATGEQRGRELGFPTANLAAENEVLPSPGVYAGWAHRVDGTGDETGPSWLAVTNVGTRPTFENAGRVLAEAHLVDFEGDLYGERIEVSFEHHLRAEQRFDGVEALRVQIAADVAEARRRASL